VHSTVKRLILHSENCILRVTNDPSLRYSFSDTFNTKYWMKRMYTFPQTSWDHIRGPSIFQQKSVAISLVSALSSLSPHHGLCLCKLPHTPTRPSVSLLTNISNVREFSAWRISGLSGVFLICVVTSVPTGGTVLHFRRLRWVFSPPSLPDRSWDSHCPLQMTLWTFSPEIKHSSNEADNSPSYSVQVYECVG